MRKIQVITIALLILSLGFIMPTLTTYAADTVTVTIDGVKQTYNPQPQILNGRVMLPLRAVCESLGIEVTYNQETHVARMQKGDTLIIHQIGTDKISINGKQQSFDTASTVIDSRTLVPIRMLAEAIEADVQWIAATNTAAITTGGLSQAQPATTQTIIQLDGKTSVILEDVIAHIGNQKVPTNKTTVFNESDIMVPIRELAKDYKPYDPSIVGADILYNTAKSFIEAWYNVDYTTVTADDWWSRIYPHFNNSWRSGTGLTGQQFIGNELNRATSQKIKMSSIFVSDPSLVYTVNENVADINVAGQKNSGHTPWSVRGVLYYKFEPGCNNGKTGDQYWDFADNEQAGKWYQVDVEIHLGINDKVTPHKATGSFSKVFWLGNASEVK